MKELKNQTSNISPESFQQSTDNTDNNEKNNLKTNKKIFIIFAFIAIGVFIIGGIVFVIYQNIQKNQTQEINIEVENASNDTNTLVENNDYYTKKIGKYNEVIAEVNDNNIFLISDNTGTIYETDLNGTKTKIVDLPYTQPIEALNTYISKDKNTFLWTHSKYSENDMNPEPMDVISYIYRRDANTFKRFNILEEKSIGIFPIQLSPDGKHLIAKKNINGKSQLVMIDTETENEKMIFDNYERNRETINGDVEIENIKFWRWNDDSQNIYYTKSLSKSNKGTKIWKTNTKLFKYDIDIKNFDLILNSNEVCIDSGEIIPSKNNENIAIVICDVDYNGMVKVYVVNLISKKSELVFEGHHGLDIAGIHINSVTPDGNKFVYYLLPQKSIFVYDITKKERKSIDLKNSLNAKRYYSSDGSKLLYENQHIPLLKTGIFSYDFETKQINQIFEDDSLHIVGF